MGKIIVKRAGLFLLFSIAYFALSAHAQSIEQPTGRIILTVKGAINSGNSVDTTNGNAERAISAQFDLTMLEKIGLTEVITETPWTNGVVKFEGVLARDLLELVKSEGRSIRAVALDNYKVDIPVEDFYQHNVILATRRQGIACAGQWSTMGDISLERKLKAEEANLFLAINLATSYS